MSQHYALQAARETAIPRTKDGLDMDMAGSLDEQAWVTEKDEPALESVLQEYHDTQSWHSIGSRPHAAKLARWNACWVAELPVMEQAFLHWQHGHSKEHVDLIPELLGSGGYLIQVVGWKGSLLT
ncbi:hypothetical protein DACRYDRAFT_15089 [Dacryopinax primogenitus]|uniref:Uncharacterized protein n=1 Tax=Dacryopinax primogenitus (strain DJM 731) TaxID=1858805 RepID=M5FYU8_DACPD|nr:uncharacterized protein DACRYDRAFT_15089 [Dacryopinax primogenitus]EJU03206.1 hypothetical protein DACRYDRAFT_15089 [Dacryopinax primogenitus]